MRKNIEKRKYFFLDSQKWELPCINSQASFNYTQIFQRKAGTNTTLDKNKSNLTTERTQKNFLSRLMQEFAKKKFKLISHTRKRYEKDQGRQFSDQKFHSQDKNILKMRKKLYLKNNISSSAVKNQIPAPPAKNKQVLNSIMLTQSINEIEEKCESIKENQLENREQFYVSKFKEFLNQNNKQASVIKNNEIKNTISRSNAFQKIHLKPIATINEYKKGQKQILVNAWQEFENTSKHSIVDYTQKFSNNKFQQEQHFA